jgi:short-subunit dehydrogenase
MADVVLITGASSGIGEATAHAFSEQGNELFLVARRADRLSQVAETCRQKGASRVIARSHDLSVAGQGAIIVRECLEQLGDLDILVCNAGYGIIGPMRDVPPRDMERIWQVNFQSGYESIHAALPHLLPKRKGHLVLVSSVVGKKAFPFSATYAATKFAQVGLGEALWGELRESGVGVSVICPGFTETEFQSAAPHTPGMRRRRRRRGQKPEVVARVIVDAIRNNRREVHLTIPGKVLLAIERLSPGLAVRIAAYVAIRERSPDPAS